MTENSRFWDGTTVGDATESPYDASTEFAQVLMAMTGAGLLPNKGGVFVDDLLGLLPTLPSANTHRTATGRGQVYGTWYSNSADIDTNIPTPASSTRIDRIVLRKDWTLQTVRITRIAGTEGGAAPALVQIVGTTWDTPISRVSITTGAVMTLTDDRVYLGGVTKVYDTVLTAAAAYVDVPVPAGFRHMRLIINGRGDAVAASRTLYGRINNDATGTYDYESTDAAAAAISASESFAQTEASLGQMPASTATANVFGTSETLFADYSNSTRNKTWQSGAALKIGTATTNLHDLRIAGFWRSNAAITSIRVFAVTGNLAIGTMITLYGMP